MRKLLAILFATVAWPAAAQVTTFPGGLGNTTIVPSLIVEGLLQAGSFSINNFSTNTLTLTPTPISSAQGIVITQSASGSITTGTGLVGTNDFGLNSITISSDNVARPSVGANKLAGALLVHEYGGSAMIGGRDSLDVISIFTAQSSASNNDHNYQAANFVWQGQANDGGTNTGGGSLGGGFAIGGSAILTGSATNFTNLSFMEANVAIATGGSVGYKSIIQLASLPQDAVQGAVTDCMLCFSGQTGAVGWKNAILLTNANGQQPLATGGCIVCSTGASTITTGFDISSYTITGNIFNATATSGTATINNNGAYVSSSSASGQPQFLVANTFNDANAADFIFQKNRAGGNTVTSDTLGSLVAYGYASGAQQLAADVQFLQSATSSGAHIPSKISLITSTATTLFGNAFAFDHNAHLGVSGGSAPTVTAGCSGAGSSISGTDLVGQVNGQTAAATSCTVTFGNAFGAAPFCTVSGQTTPVTSYTPSTGTLVINFASTASAKFNWWCEGA